jgi:acyl-CoA reductase-like NAD-dependent aldehyde dehydrogenase
MSLPSGASRYQYDKLFIDGKWIDPGGEQDLIINPADESVLGCAPAGTAADAERAFAAARRAFDDGPWPRETRDARANAMQRLYGLVDARSNEILELMQLEMGFPRMQCVRQFDLVQTQMKKFIEVARKDPTKTLPLIVKARPQGARSLGGALVTRDPIGVVSAITPYNSGFLLGLIKCVPAMAAGNTVILKPSPYTPLQSLLIAELVAELDLPPGVFNLVTGNAEVGRLMSSDRRVDMVSFTGSDSVGSMVMAQAAPTLKKVHLELGGKSPLIIRHDADMTLAVTAGIYGFIFQAGQGCSMTTRMLVDSRIRSRFVDALAAAAGKLKVGDPAEADTFMGPLIRETARTRTEDFCRRALSEGATLVLGGKRPASLPKGFFFEPTIFDNVANDSYLGQREVFGPIAAVVSFDTDADAVRLANASDYGLGGAIVSQDAATALEMALQVRTGQIQINGGPGGFHPDMPFGGYKRSGIGREWGEEGFYEYTELKAVGFPVGRA